MRLPSFPIVFRLFSMLHQNQLWMNGLKCETHTAVNRWRFLRSIPTPTCHFGSPIANISSVARPKKNKASIIRLSNNPTKIFLTMSDRIISSFRSKPYKLNFFAIARDRLYKMHLLAYSMSVYIAGPFREIKNMEKMAERTPNNQQRKSAVNE